MFFYLREEHKACSLNSTLMRLFAICDYKKYTAQSADFILQQLATTISFFRRRKWPSNCQWYNTVNHSTLVAMWYLLRKKSGLRPPVVASCTWLFEVVETNTCNLYEHEHRYPASTFLCTFSLQSQGEDTYCAPLWHTQRLVFSVFSPRLRYCVDTFFACKRENHFFASLLSPSVHLLPLIFLLIFNFSDSFLSLATHACILTRWRSTTGCPTASQHHRRSSTSPTDVELHIFGSGLEPR